MDVNATISSAAGILGSLTLTGILSAILTLIVCLVFVGGVVLLVPLVMVAIAAGILKACL